ncbi:hypothetical protein Patl1_05573 [Pistacia atlantica]|uniref:Uncharacterized protein n=1 Tax=Pistacia atlantica TaxID=434234 RepID=A0ACC1BPS9_9ROSI|nr:hypothetical protein Patl1_05573 [Pistacia atlantica]
MLRLPMNCGLNSNNILPKTMGQESLN